MTSPAVHAHSGETLAPTDRRQELGRFLRARREQVSPASVGLPAGGRRRTPGLRREEVAQLSAVGTTWYTWLEQGRDINPSSQVLGAIAGALQLDADERSHLLRLGGHTPPPRESGPCDVAPTIQPILDALLPNPAVLMSPRSDVLAYNSGFRFMIADLETIPPDERNCIWLDFTDPDWLTSYVDANDEQEAIVARARAIYADTLDDPLWPAFVDRLSARSETFRELWNSGRVLNQADWNKRIRCRHVGVLNLRVTTFNLRDRPRLRMMTYLPRDTRTRDRLRELQDLIGSGVIG